MKERGWRVLISLVATGRPTTRALGPVKGWVRPPKQGQERRSDTVVLLLAPFFLLPPERPLLSPPKKIIKNGPPNRQRKKRRRIPGPTAAERLLGCRQADKPTAWNSPRLPDTGRSPEDPHEESHRRCRARRGDVLASCPHLPGFEPRVPRLRSADHVPRCSTRRWSSVSAPVVVLVCG